MPLQSRAEVSTLDPPWVVLVEARTSAPTVVRPHWWVYAQLVGLTLVVLAVVGTVGAVLSSVEARREAVVDATQRARVVTEAVVEPSLRDDVLTGSAASTAVLDQAVRRFVLGDAVVRVKLWSGDGRILYSDERRLMGERYDLSDDERAVLRGDGVPSATVSDLREPENRFEVGHGKLLEVYSRVLTPSGEPLLFETYYRYSSAHSRVGEIWRSLVLVAWSSVTLLLLLLLPVIWPLVRRLRRAQEQREMLLVRAADTSTAERRRIAATLHDGVVQDLAATSFVLAGAAASAGRSGQGPLAADLDSAADAVRASIGGLRSLLVEIYPPSLSATGLEAVLVDLAGSPATRGLEVDLQLPQVSTVRLDRDGERLVFRVVQECLRNVVRHASAQHVTVRLTESGGSIVLGVTDDGIGFDPERVLRGRSADQYGLRLMVEDARQASALLRVRSAPGHGTRWELRVTPR